MNENRLTRLIGIVISHYRGNIPAGDIGPLLRAFAAELEQGDETHQHAAFQAELDRLTGKEVTVNVSVNATGVNPQAVAELAEREIHRAVAHVKENP